MIKTSLRRKWEIINEKKKLNRADFLYVLIWIGHRAILRWLSPELTSSSAFVRNVNSQEEKSNKLRESLPWSHKSCTFPADERLDNYYLWSDLCWHKSYFQFADKGSTSLLASALFVEAWQKYLSSDHYASSMKIDYAASNLPLMRFEPFPFLTLERCA